MCGLTKARRCGATPPTGICRFFFPAEDGIRDKLVTGVQTCALPISVPLLLRSLCASHGAHLSRRELPSATGLRPDDASRAGHGGTKAHGAGGAQSLVVARPHDVRTFRRQFHAQRRIAALEDQALLER